MDQEPWRRTRRHEAFHGRDIDLEQGEHLLATFAALALHAVLADAVAAGSPLSIETLHAIPLRTVADAATGKRDYEFLAGLPTSFADEADETAVNTFRLFSYQTGGTGLWLFYLSRELRHVLVTLVERSRTPTPTCEDLSRWANEAGLQL
ncbi:hypothetical protein ACWD6R_32175 [Streptomyces sp. NPDC005151]